MEKHFFFGCEQQFGCKKEKKTQIKKCFYNIKVPDKRFLLCLSVKSCRSHFSFFVPFFIHQSSPLTDGDMNTDDVVFWTTLCFPPKLPELAGKSR
jgi:hypothetical protein